MSKLDDIAQKAYEEYAYKAELEVPWYSLDHSAQEMWRDIVRLVVSEAAAANALCALGDEP